MIKHLQIIPAALSLGLYACSQPSSDETQTQETTREASAQSYKFTKEEVTNLVMASQGYLDGHMPETGLLKEGSTLLIFEDEFAWAFGHTSPENLQGGQTRLSWRINRKGQIVLRDIPDDPKSSPSPSPSDCTLTKTNEHERKFTDGGLAEKIDVIFDCDTFPRNGHYKQTFLLPSPLFPHMLPGTTTRRSSKPEAISTFLADRTVQRPSPVPNGKIDFFFDPYKGGKFQNSVTVYQTNSRYPGTGDTTGVTGKHRLLMFGHSTPQHSIMLDLSYSSVIYMPPGDDGYTRQTTDRYELHSIYRIKNLTYNAKIGNYPDRPSNIARSVNANVPPLKSALIFTD